MSWCAAGAVYAEADTGLKAGLWETSTQKMVMDGKDMLPEMLAAQKQMREELAKMSPEQRKQMEALLAGQTQDPLTQRMCVSAAMAKRNQPMLPKPQGADCGDPKMERQGNRMAFDFSCKQADGSTVVGKGEVVNADGLVSTKINTTTTIKGGAKRSLMAETTMKFLGADCGGLKPIDQLAKEAQAQMAAHAEASRKAQAKAEAAAKRVEAQK
ncbi:DUF3617 domain-containing protein [Ottowia sp.]|uniref:DUF3617 domain-containing protein n=1 Tax=Ottowia sp. TaxID=1898956 RepID=UPI003A85ACB0